MKKALVSMFSAALIALSVPALAFAASPDTVTASTSVTAASGTAVSVSASGKKLSADAFVKIEAAPAGEQASNTPAGADVLASFVVTQKDTEPPYTFSYTLGAEYANADVSVYIQHEDNTTEVVEKTADANGTITFEQTKLSIHTIVAKKAAAGSAAATAKKDSGAMSPQTGLHTTEAAAVTGVALVAAAGAAVVLRKKVSE